ncbi:MAG: hypothetical protein M3P10_07465 [Actinomycetota bacterium]|nr:hypothetical protein [Actinomycetota bacterium]
MATKKVTVTVPENVSFTANGRVYRTGETFEVDRADVEPFIRGGSLVEVTKKAR